ncbi:hypothetical protein L249_7138 [Ophiocordyceps polyrhachis-furcata BCC 54312]|uniref:Uncharacterized protein n=1 Tax=Ophiocordyceps polyrhachis-furcata BCC 54312 TaxID=1330021 RepID=A0A367LAT0_9HYPO|nr:hypothetical protein L249_7138 [Ophiocordyceps polyrhachis-furcata BCC 54312]
MGYHPATAASLQDETTLALFTGATDLPAPLPLPVAGPMLRLAKRYRTSFAPSLAGSFKSPIVNRPVAVAVLHLVTINHHHHYHH